MDDHADKYIIAEDWNGGEFYQQWGDETFDSEAAANAEIDNLRPRFLYEDFSFFAVTRREFDELVAEASSNV